MRVKGASGRARTSNWKREAHRGADGGPARPAVVPVGRGGTSLVSYGLLPVPEEEVEEAALALAAAAASALAEEGEKLGRRLRPRNANLDRGLGGVTGSGRRGTGGASAGGGGGGCLGWWSWRPRRKSEMSEVRERTRPEGARACAGMAGGVKSVGVCVGECVGECECEWEAGDGQFREKRAGAGVPCNGSRGRGCDRRGLGGEAGRGRGRGTGCR